MTKKIVLVLEDDEAMKNKLIKFLEKNYDVIIHKNDKSEKSFFLIGYLDLIIADLSSIKSRKMEMLIDLKSSPIIFKVPFLFITSNKNNDSKKLNKGMNYYLNKPFSENEFLTLLDKILEDDKKISPW